MKSKKVFLVIIMALSLFSLPGCKGLIPSSFEIETTSELGPNTLNRIDDINDTLATGMEIGPETRATIEELNQTIDDGLEFGFTESTLQRVDVLLGMVEQGVGIKAGLDAETNQTVNNLIDTLGDQPGQWEDTMTSIITTLEGSSSRVAEQMADEVEGLMVEARLNTQELSASMGAEFRCNVDFMSTRAGDTLDQFIGRSLVGRLRSIVSGEELEEETEDEIPIPRVCQMVPDQVDLEEIDEEIKYNDVIKISGYNFVEENKPHAYVADANGNPLPDIELYPPVRSTSYQLQLNLQGIDFSSVPAGSIMILEWPVVNVGDESAKNELSILLPSEEPEPTEEIRAEVTIDVDTLDVRVGPGEEYAALDEIAVRGATYEITGHNGGKTWWQIEFNRDLGWVPDEAVTAANTELVGPVSVPKDPPQAAFSMEPQGGNAPLVVHFLDESTGDPTVREWWIYPEVGNGTEFGSSQEASHQFAKPGTYTVRLVVGNQLGEDTAEQTIQIEESEVTRPESTPFRGLAPEYDPPEYARDVIFWNKTGIPGDTWFGTEISTEEYNCAVISFAALEGDISQSGIRNLIRIELYDNQPYWRGKVDVLTPISLLDPDPSETWSIGLMCVEKELSFFDRIHIDQGLDGNTKIFEPSIEGVSRNHTRCIIAGFDIRGVDMDEKNTGDIIQVFTRPIESEEEELQGKWEVTADFLEEDGDESWFVDVLCFYDHPGKPDQILVYDEVGSFEYLSVENGPYQTEVNASEYACGVAGMEALAGEMGEDYGDIFQVYTYTNQGKWWIYPDFRSENTHEKWNIDLVCVNRSMVDMTLDDWKGKNWIRP